MTEEIPLWRQPVTYGAVGGTKAKDILAYPPAGFRPMVRRTRIGHGENRFLWASARTMSWGIQRMSGFEVTVEQAPASVTDGTYIPVTFDNGGTPVEAATRAEADEDTYSPDGSSFLVPGDSATMTTRFAFVPVTAAVRVVYVVDEPDRKGFGYGTLAQHPESGEESFIVERTDDGSVWLTITSFSRPSRWYWWVLCGPLRAAQAIYTRRYLRVLSGSTD